MIDTVFVVVFHYAYEAAVEFFADIGDHLFTHYVVILVIKIGAAHVVAVIVHRVRKVRKDKKDETHGDSA